MAAPTTAAVDAERNVRLDSVRLFAMASIVGAVCDFKCPKYSAMRIELNRVAVTLD
jgi:hypothetical protein